MRNILFCGNSKVFDGVLTCMLSVLKRTHATDPFCFYIFTMDMTRIRPEYTPISEDMTNFLERVAKKFHPQNRVISVDVTVLYERYFGGCPNERRRAPPVIFVCYYHTTLRGKTLSILKAISHNWTRAICE